MIRYPERFVRLAKESYPGFEALHRALDEGSEMAGRYLGDSRGLVLFSLDAGTD